jgi:hypothetical protein
MCTNAVQESGPAQVNINQSINNNNDDNDNNSKLNRGHAATLQ